MKRITSIFLGFLITCLFCPNELTAQVTAIITSTTDASCNGSCDGTASGSATGGVLPYTYTWNTVPVQTDSFAFNLCSGTYLWIVADNIGATDSVAFTITEPPFLAITASSTDETCTSCCDGTATGIASGGLSPYTHLWDDPASQTNSIATGLCPGLYTTTIVDANGCATTAGVAVNTGCIGPTVSISVTPDCLDTCEGSATAVVTAGVPPYTYFWDDPGAQTTQTAIYLCAGIYTVIVTDANGCITTMNAVISNVCGPNQVNGSVFDDLNSDCITDNGEVFLPGWIIRSDPGPYYTITDNAGNYRLYLDSGAHTISLLDNQLLWSQNCPVSPSTYSLNLGATPDTIDSIHFGMQADFYCALMHVDISTWAVRPCFNSYYTVSYCNFGTLAANNATVEVELDLSMSYIGSTGSLLSQNGDVLTFQLDTVSPGQCGSFQITVYVTCDLNLLGSTMCVDAHIYPDSSCIAPDTTWDKSSVMVEGSCVIDSISLACFTITNTGSSVDGNMQGTSEYRIYENNILVATNSFQINGGDSLVICWPANGNTIRLEADQRPGHPGNSNPQDNVELCGDTISNFVINQITQTPPDDADNFVDIDCRVVTGSYDPNDKQVMPTGLTDTYHYIDSTIELEYQIRFQNTGTDTAFTVVVKDTISGYLDITSIRPLGSSHSYTVDILEGNVVQWTFANILLPDSNINEPQSHGFVKYKIQQQVGNVLGTVIENNAGIYFDFNPPIITNTVFNTIGDIEALTTQLAEIYNPDYSIHVYPNPFNSTTTFEIGHSNPGPLSFELYNLVGKRVKLVSDITGASFILNRDDLSDGIYIYKIYSAKGLIGAGKLVVN